MFSRIYRVAALSALSFGLPVSASHAAPGQLPMRFEPGVWDSGVEFSAQANGYTDSLTSGEAILSFSGQTRGISLVKANLAPRIEGAGRLRATGNYFVGSRKDWRTDVPHYSRVRYAEVYP